MNKTTFSVKQKVRCLTFIQKWCIGARRARLARKAGGVRRSEGLKLKCSEIQTPTFSLYPCRSASRQGEAVGRQHTPREPQLTSCNSPRLLYRSAESNCGNRHPYKVPPQDHHEDPT